MQVLRQATSLAAEILADWQSTPATWVNMWLPRGDVVQTAYCQPASTMSYYMHHSMARELNGSVALLH